MILFARRLTVKYLSHTHCHIDHVLGNDHVKEKYKVNLLIHTYDDLFSGCEVVRSQLRIWRLSRGFADQLLKEGDTVQFGTKPFMFWFLPGHSPARGFYNPRAKGNYEW